jgi:hypothetical protein
MTKIGYINFIGKTYVALALVAAAIFSPPALSFAPVLLLLGHLYLWRWPHSPVIEFLAHYFLYFALAALFSAFVPALVAPALSLPVIILILGSLEKAAPFVKYRFYPRRRNLSMVGAICLSIPLAVLLLALVFTNLPLVLSSTVALLCFSGLIVCILRNLRGQPLDVQPVSIRILAGDNKPVAVDLHIRTRYGGVLLVQPDQSPVKVLTPVLSLKGSCVSLRLSLNPGLSGPSSVKLKAMAVDRWGLLATFFEIEPVKMLVVPRARYADWLARKYLSGTRPGILPLLSNIEGLKTLHGLRQGIEYYGHRPYQPGDNIKTVDWKHSYKSHELVIKEFTEFHGQPAIILINLVAGDAEAADKLACNIILTAITLGQVNIPSALAAYNEKEVVLTTGGLAPMQVLLKSLQLVKSIVISPHQIRYLNPPDVLRLKANIWRIGQSDNPPAKVLGDLLRLEYKSLSASAGLNPCTRAFSETMAKVNGPSSVVVLSQRNHDAEALAFQTAALSQKGNAVINI